MAELVSEAQDSRYTDKLHSQRNLSQRHIQKVKQLDGRDGQIAERLSLTGEDRMSGPLPLEAATEPDERHHAAPLGYLNSQIASAREKIRSTNASISNDARDVTKWLKDFDDYIQSVRDRRND